MACLDLFLLMVLLVGFPGGSVGKESACNAEDRGSTPRLGGQEDGMATHSSILTWRIPMDSGAWWAAVYGVAQSRARLKRLSSSRQPMHGLPWWLSQ